MTHQETALEQGNAFMVRDDWPVPPGFRIKCNHDTSPYLDDQSTIDIFAGDVLVGRWEGDDIQVWASDPVAKDMVRTILISLAERANKAWKKLNDRRDRECVLAQKKLEDEANAAVLAAMAHHKDQTK